MIRIYSTNRTNNQENFTMISTKIATTNLSEIIFSDIKNTQ